MVGYYACGAFISLCKKFFNLMILLMACPSHELSQLFMKIVCGNWGHIKARWDNHLNCLSCSSCSRFGPQGLDLQDLCRGPLNNATC